LEPLSYSLKPTVKNLCSEEQRKVVIETARRLTLLGADILKAEFPLEITEIPNEDVCFSARAELTETSHVPWTLLSAGVTFEDFTRQVKIACLSGASGVITGRAVWIEAIELESKKDAF
jgi:tagatose 1,6-diphosphate aldolase